jgi:amidohydrolase
MYPELGFEEVRTGKIITKYLEACGIETRTMTKTGVVGLLRGGKPGLTVMLRADMDGLPVAEETGLPFKSATPGKMHACGHDGHMAMLLVAAKILSEEKENLCGNVKFCFQPNEEDAGAELMIGDGVLENPHVDVCLGVHLWQPIPAGSIGLKEGAVMAGMDNFRLIIHGKGGHSGEPHKAVDPITAACAVISNISFIEKREIGTLYPTIITVNTIHGGTATNVISERVEMTGTLRYLYDPDDNLEQRPRIRFERIVKSICEVYGTSYTMEFKPSSSTLINNAEVVSHLRPVAESVVGADNIVPYVCMMGEDFAEFTKRVKGAFAFIGVGNTEKGINYPHHHPKFDIDEDALLKGVEFHVKAAYSYLR